MEESQDYCAADIGSLASLGTLEAYQQCGSRLCCCISDTSGHCVRCFGTYPQRQKTLGVKWVRPGSLVMSYFVRNPWVILCFRVLCLIYAGVVLVADFLSNFEGTFWFAYLSNLAYIALFIYFLCSSFLSAKYCFNLTPEKKKAFRARKATAFEVLTSIVYTTQFAMHMVVPIVYWYDWFNGQDLTVDNFLSKPPVRIWTVLSKHGGDLILMLIECYFNRVILVWGHFVIIMVSMVLYIGWLFGASKIWPTSGPKRNGFPYGFLSSDVSQLGYTIGNFAIVAAIFVLAWVVGFFVCYIRAIIGKRHQRSCRSRHSKVFPSAGPASSTVTSKPVTETTPIVVEDA